MEDHLFAGVNLRPERIHFLDGAAADLDAECDRYEEAIAAAGGIDLQILGIGSNGHIGFNEPGDDPSRVPHEALSMGTGTILHARRIVLVATGGKKAECIRQSVSGRITTRVPASMLQVHPDVELLLDEEAAALIGRT